jgi:hypothetical protein
MTDTAETDITIEVFNHCAGTCTGCMLSALERKSVQPVMGPEDFAAAMQALAGHGAKAGLSYRVVLVFGDVPWLPAETLARYFGAAADAGHRLGATMTLVEVDRAERYGDGLAALTAADPTAVFDITLDPVRLERDESYAGRCRTAMAAAPHLHLAALLSEAVLAKWGPEELAALFRDRLGERAVSLGFTPTLTNLEKRNYGYQVTSAAGYARRFYQATPEGRAHLEAELERFRAEGSYGDFLRQSFHIGPDLSVYPVAYTIFGDVIMDARNGGRALGRIGAEGLTPLLSGMGAQALSVKNDIFMERGDFGCGECGNRPSCGFNGIGLARNLYRDHEAKTGSCYGPKGLA